MGTLTALTAVMLNTIDLARLDHVFGGAATKPAPAAEPPKSAGPATPPPTPQRTQPPRRYIQEGPRGSDDGAFIRSTITCARIGGPILGAICGVLTPSPAY